MKTQDIYNLKQDIKKKGLGDLTAIQSLIHSLENDSSWNYVYRTDKYNRVTHLFCIHEHSRRLLWRYPWTLVADCTYKTNRFVVPLLIFVGLTGRNTSF